MFDKVPNAPLKFARKVNYSQQTFICSKSTVKTLEKRVKYVGCSDIFTVNLDHISHLFLVFALLSLSTYELFSASNRS